VARELGALLPLLRCPRSGEALRLVGDTLTSTGHTYPLVNGKPVLVAEADSAHLLIPEAGKISRNAPEFHVPAQYEAGVELAMHLGCGDVPSADPRVVSVDVFPLEHVDVIAEAEVLPFVSESFDYIESGATFEHVSDPLQAIREVKRVLKPGGRFRIDTAFMQSYHGFPGHYFNMTPLAVETHLVDDFELEASEVPDSATPLVAIESLVERLLSYLPRSAREELLEMSLRDVLAAFREAPSRSGRWLAEQSEYAMRAMAASFVVIAKKPADDERRRQALAHPAIAAHWASRKRAYFATRMEVMLRYHEVQLYRRMARESGYTGPEGPSLVPLEALLVDALPSDTLSPEALERSLAQLRDIERAVRSARDYWIREYLERSG
jgi:SAM-dependent methyltransferase